MRVRSPSGDWTMFEPGSERMRRASISLPFLPSGNSGWGRSATSHSCLPKVILSAMYKRKYVSQTMMGAVLQESESDE